MPANNFGNAVLEESARWVSPWHPPGASVVQNDGFKYYIFEAKAVLMDADLSLRQHGLVERFSESAKQHNARTIEITVGPGPWDGVDRNDLMRVGGRVVSELDILAARPTSAFAETITTSDLVTVDPVVSRVQSNSFIRVSNEAWGYDPPSDDDLEKSFGDLQPGSFLAYFDGAPAGTGGYSLAGSTARFWGASVLKPFRHLGVYRALVRARLDDAERRDARVALVHAEPTSSPILRSLGFDSFGSKTTISIEV